MHKVTQSGDGKYNISTERKGCRE